MPLPGKRATKSRSGLPNLLRQAHAPRQIKEIRLALVASQSVFAYILNVSPKVVQSWEHGARRPTNAALKLLSIAQSNPHILLQPGSAPGRGASRREPRRPVRRARTEKTLCAILIRLLPLMYFMSGKTGFLQGQPSAALSFFPLEDSVTILLGVTTLSLNSELSV